jgi:hypothetical protein
MGRTREWAGHAVVATIPATGPESFRPPFHHRGGLLNGKSRH